ncbi:MAG: DsrE family protein [Candidatus Nanohaloarchaea archaeon]
MRVVFHVDESGKVGMTLANVANLLEDEPDAAVAVVVNSAAVMDLARGSEYAEEIGALAAEGVEVVACGNSLGKADIGSGELLDPVETVPSGVGMIARRQADGWHYIRP